MVHNVRGQVSEARSRLLSTATRIFYSEGLHSVGIDRIVAEAKVTRATLYRHFASKDDLVVAYLQTVAQMDRDQVEQALGSGLPADQALRAVAQGIAAGIESAGFRGCAFLNAAAEFPDPAHPVLNAVLEHRAWFLQTITDLFAQIEEKSAAAAARHFVMLRDGAMAAGCLTDPAAVGATFLAGVEGLLTYRSGAAS
ncbi:TetR/AcrR family transcriptional regulator [Lentzea albida]|uniref:Transcriptional regulator, TetR family n=1 Tax=Lentzea albida TaxID=65499 RepID=A0A1H9K4T8_9PSEU|nr:TetR/AcrR family transcriptional regulator [Lentzea albida]SEQ93927.1 transcriptional regulator, TetR family [Lentzea albida]